MSLFNLLTKIRQAKQVEGLRPAEVIRLNKSRFQRLLRHVLTNSDFYKEYYGQQGVTLDNYEEVNLKDLPPIDKQLMMEHYDDFVCDPLLKREDLEKFISDPANRGKKYKNRYQVIHTSGSSGTIGIFVYGPEEWDLLRAMVMTRVSKTPVSPFKKTKLAFMGAIDGHFAGISLAQGAPRLFIDILPLSINSPMAEICQKINQFQPDALSGYASGTFLLAEEQIKGNIDINPQRIICSADPLTSRIRETVEKAFGIAPINFYAASESIGLAAECDTHRGFHLFNDWHCFEVVDRDLEPTQSGKPGKVLLTNLYNYTQPLIRYEMRDEIILDDAPCPCGSPFPLIKNIAGREEEFLWFEKSDGIKEYVHPSVIVEFFAPGLKKFQILQTKMNKFLMKVIIQGRKEDVLLAIDEKMKKILKGKGLEGAVSFDVEVVQEIRNDPKTGKFKLIIC